LIISDDLESIEIDNNSELDLIKAVSKKFNKQWTKERLGHKDISTLILDIDGVLASNYKPMSKNERIYSTQDSNALSNFIKNGGTVYLISSESIKHSQNLFKKIGINYLKFNSKNKLEDVKKFLNIQKIDKQEVCFVGNDVQDLDCIKYFNISAVPNDSNESVKPFAKIQLESNGGQGAVVEILELIKK
jgi:3-deoxy-D-manno-octulosonate 8-phosphate phosphatase (KDO 8-P phosphatase)